MLVNIFFVFMVIYIVQSGCFVNSLGNQIHRCIKITLLQKNREGCWNDNTAMIGINTGRFQTLTTDWHKYCCKTWYMVI